jgi:two-component system LytT family sensor kinase
MKKLNLLFLLVFIFAKPTYSQVDWSKYSQSYPKGSTDKPSNIGIIVAIREINNSFWNKYPNEPLIRSLENDTSFARNRPKEFVAINAFDTAKAQFFLHGVNKLNAAEYEYRVIEGQKTIVPWSGITLFTNAKLDAQSAMGQIAYLGGYNARIGDKIIVDARKKGNGAVLASSVVMWVPIKPFLSDIYTAGELNIFLNRLARPYTAWQKGAEITKWRKQNVETAPGKPGQLLKNFLFEATDNNLVFYFDAAIYNKEQLEYQLVKNEEVIKVWQPNDFDNDFVWLKDLSSGQYMLNVRYSAQKEHVSQYRFEIKTPWVESIAAKIIAGVLACASLGFVIFFILHIKQKQRAEQELSKKTRLQLELKAVYAQLNPHFIFNALSSIQGLINKQDVKGANDYLTDFARLMRETLNESNKDQTPLKQEVSTLETYLKLEQLRFGFKYVINIAENINVYETEVPPLLLQPIIENAVKHGVSALLEKGTIIVNFSQEKNDMLVLIADNGGGFPANENTNGVGIKLTRDRIKLLNELSKEQTIILEIKGNSPTGTIVGLNFKNWFL